VAFVGTSGVVGTYTGLADVGVATMTECLTIAGWIAQSVRFPVIIDGDTGHGGIMAVRRLIAEAIRASLAGIRIDDQPIEGKRSTQDAGVEVVPLEQALVRYRAAVDMKNELDPDFVIMAQCYARDAANGGLEDCLARLRAYEEVAGVDWVQFESPHSVEEIQQARACVAGPFSFMRGKLPRYLSLDEHQALGVHIAWYPAFTHEVMYAALWDFLQDFQARPGGVEPFRPAQEPALSPPAAPGGRRDCRQTAPWRARPLLASRNIQRPERNQGGAAMLASHGRYPCAPWKTARISSGRTASGSPHPGGQH
jgi:2-methylisocitrate lyase-like PEP mutase family enzyme